MTALLVLPVIIMPRVSTMSPSTHSKELAIRVLLGFLAVGAGLAWPLLDRRRLDLVDWAALALIGANFLSALASGRFAYCFLEAWHLWVLPVLLLLVPRLRPSIGTLKAMALSAIAAGALASAYGFLAFFGHNPLQAFYPFQVGSEGRNYMHSFLGNPEYFGGFMSPVAVLCAALALRPGIRLREAVLYVGGALVFLLAVALSGTRGAFLGFGVAALVVAWRQLPLLSRRMRRMAIAVFAAAALLGAAGLFVLSTPNPLNTRDLRLAQRFALLFDLDSPSVRERIMFYALSGDMIGEDPLFGSGPGTFKVEFYRAVERLVNADPRAGVILMVQDLQNRVAEHAHNDYLEIWAETGTVGFAAFLLVLAALLVRFFAVAPRGLEPHQLEPNLLRTAFFATALCIFVNAAFSFPLHLPARAFLAWSALGAFLAADRLTRRA